MGYGSELSPFDLPWGNFFSLWLSCSMEIIRVTNRIGVTINCALIRMSEVILPEKPNPNLSVFCFF